MYVKPFGACGRVERLTGRDTVGLLGLPRTRHRHWQKFRECPTQSICMFAQRLWCFDCARRYWILISVLTSYQ